MSIYILPPEIITLILFHIPDKTQASMTCKLFQKLLQTLYDTHQLSDINDSYYFSKIPDVYPSDKICNIKNNNILNLIAYKFLIKNQYKYLLDAYYIYIVLRQNYILNNISKPDYLIIMLTYVSFICIV
jgi:hypothetical protein